MSNRLAAETSPYLLQHQNNPVDWHPWGPEALARAKAEERPIFLSIGYSACHWCHVMEHESFENPQIAALMNEHFVNIKVDREERPDLDQIYMNAVQAMTGHGGWPMSVFLTPDLKPFYGGTYWPPAARMGMPGFDQILHGVAEHWATKREHALQYASQLTEALRTAEGRAGGDAELSPRLVHNAAVAMERAIDLRHGGFGRAPKFPHAMDLRVLMRVHARQPTDGVLQMIALTLNKMAAGGIYDHLGGGFHRYSVDERWLVPHFEKMLYDNALLTSACVEGYLLTGNEDYARVARDTIEYVLRDMTDPTGGFYSTEDADSEGHEGKFYVWTPQQIADVLGEEAAVTFNYVYDVSEHGNFEGQNILNLPKTLAQCAQIRRMDLDALKRESAESRAKLLAERSKRVRPARDDKVLVSWNGMMIDALCQAAVAFGEPRYLQAAGAAAEFILQNLRRTDGRLLHTWRSGKAKLDAYLDDYTCLINALVSLYEASFEERWIDEAAALTETVLKHFRDEQEGNFFFTADDHEQLVTRTKDLVDSSVPSGNAMAATALLRLGKLTGESRYLDAAYQTLKSAAGIMQQSPTAAGQMLIALDFHFGPTPEIVLLGDPTFGDTAAALADLRQRYLPNKVVAARDPAAEQLRSPRLDPLFAGKTRGNEEPTVYVCENFACQAPVHGLGAAREQWDKLSG